MARKKNKNNTGTQTPRVLDNRGGGKVGDFLKRAITPGAQVRAVSAYFSIHAHRALKDQLEDAQKFQFLFGDPKSAASLLGDDAEQKPYHITESGIAPTFALMQKPAARDCKEWLENGRENGTVAVKTLTSGFLHGKMYAAEQKDGKGAAVSGSSNFTARGLGFAQDGGNWELNTVADDKTRAELRKWFDDLWNSDQVKNAEGEMLDALNRLGENEIPEFVYYLTLYRLFKDELEAAEKSESDLRLGESTVWRALYPFQRDAVGGIIRRLTQHGVCILADSVGLGKTYTALAVMKFYQNQRILVLCPKRLEGNWWQFHFFAGGHNPLTADNLRYEIKAHTDLARGIKKFAWDKFDLVVIDESHNFRNHNGARYKELSDSLRRSGAKVLMLSATPINTSLRDLRNQIWLGANDGAFAKTLGIRSVRDVASFSQGKFAEWEAQDAQDKDALMENLGGPFLKLMDAVTVARSRTHIKNYYADNENKRPLDFPEAVKPKNLYSATDSEGELSYADMHANIGKFGLSIYSPSKYLLVEEEPQGAFLQSDREHYLIGMMRVNLLKRLESSAFAFRQTVARTIDKIRDVEDMIADCQKGGEAKLFNTEPGQSDGEGENEGADGGVFTVGKRRKYKSSELNLNEWAKDLEADRNQLEEILEKAEKVTTARDAKLAELKRLLRDKAENPTINKGGDKNRKALVFTSFADTARYLYKNLVPLADDLGLKIALVVGSGDNATTAQSFNQGKLFISAQSAEENTTTSAKCPLTYSDILHHFSPGADKTELAGEEIDILIATDCVSEGQNLQDCDLVVNYDIHWNPVRIVQRFGRIDRIGSPAEKVRMANFWPDIDLNKYLFLEERVKSRMAIVAIGGAGVVPGEENEPETLKAIAFRTRQLQKLRDEALDADEIDDVAISDFTLADFLAELRAYLKKNEEKFKRAPEGICAVVNAEPEKGAHPGVIFCLRNKHHDDEQRKRDNRLHPYYLVYVREGINNNPHVCFTYAQAKKSLRLFGELCRGKTGAIADLCAAFDAETENGKNMAKYDAMLGTVVKNIAKETIDRAAKELSGDRSAALPFVGGTPQTPEDFELSSWLVIRGEGK